MSYHDRLVRRTLVCGAAGNGFGDEAGRRLMRLCQNQPAFTTRLYPAFKFEDLTGKSPRMFYHRAGFYATVI